MDLTQCERCAEADPDSPIGPTLIVQVASGKYTVRQMPSGRLFAERYGKPWQELTGNNLVHALACELEESRLANARLLAALSTSDPQTRDAHLREARKHLESHPIPKL